MLFTATKQRSRDTAVTREFGEGDLLTRIRAVLLFRTKRVHIDTLDNSSDRAYICTP